MRFSAPVAKRAAGAVGVTVAVGGALVACTASAHTGQSRKADTAAVTAGTVMTRGLGPVPARDAAWQVTGTRPDQAIAAVQATGTTYQGTVVLRITTGLDGPEGSAPVTRCYRYLFRHRLNDKTPQRLAQCPHRPALRLTAAPPPAAVTEATRRRLIVALGNLTRAQRARAAAIRRAVLPAFPAPLVVNVSGPGLGRDAAIQVTITNTQVEYASSCVTAYLPAGRTWKVRPVATGTDCRGG